MGKDVLMATTDTPTSAPFASGLERRAWRISLGTLVGRPVIMVGVWE